jgi:hypothetical protein
LAAVLLASVLSSAAQSADDRQKCTLLRQASLDMTIDASGRANVPMTVAGHELRMLVDTGGFVSELNAATVKSLDLPTGGIAQSGIVMFNGDRVMLAAHVKDALLTPAAPPHSVAKPVYPSKARTPTTDSCSIVSPTIATATAGRARPAFRTAGSGRGMRCRWAR